MPILSNIVPYQPFFSFYWQQVAAQICVDLINNSPVILPNTTILVKRFDNTLSGKSIGGINMHVANEIGQHEDVVAVIGEVFGSLTRFSAQVYAEYKLPFCGPSSTFTKLLDKSLYPYFFQTLTMTGDTETLVLLLKSFKSSRIAVISDNSYSPFCKEYVKKVRQNGIQVVTIITNASEEMADNMAKLLHAADAHYFVICASPSNTADIYYSMAFSVIPRLVGPDYLWISKNLPLSDDEEKAIEKWGPEYYTESTGIFVLQSVDESTESTEQMKTILIDQIHERQAPWTRARITESDIASIGVALAFDCAGILGVGMHNLLEDGSFTPDQLSSRQLQHHMNWTLFQNTGKLTVHIKQKFIETYHGDLEAPYIVGSIYDIQTFSINCKPI
ncbi:UNVERIFIED_CONTAM: hypothetical protein HDU68_011514 [Siphonaria sp. JEL0065]|nr:hypothetical protein HDU68_011514 [Siphonaria sp. JEL0065]